MNMYGITGMGDPIDFMIMQSETDANAVIRNFNDFISQGHAPEEAEAALRQDARHRQRLSVL